MDIGVMILLAVGAIAAICYADKKGKGLSGMNDTPVSIENVRKGVERGWYKAVLMRVNGVPAIYLYGKDTNGNTYGDTYPISESDWQTLKREGYPEQ